MPNFLQIQALREKYARKDILLKSQMSDRDIDSVVKNFSDSRSLNESLSFDSRNNIMDYLERQKEAHLVTIFIDICSFSTKIKGLKNHELSDFLDIYYKTVYPIIFEFGGEVEKVIGDGIIAIFGQPFLDDSLDKLLERADNCSKKIVDTLEGTKAEVKIALHDGIVKYHKNKESKLPEYSIIGHVLTGLFRLESISFDNKVNFYSNSSYDKKYNNEFIYTWIGAKLITWRRSEQIEVNLKGIDDRYVRNYGKEQSSSNYNNYNINDYIQRIDNLSFRKVNELTVHTEIPNTLDINSIFHGIVLTISINSKIDRTEYAKVINLLLQEIGDLLNKSSKYLKILASGKSIQVIANGHYIYQLVDLYCDSLLISSLLEIIIYKIKKSDNLDLKIGIGLSFGDINVIDNAITGVQYFGNVFDNSKNLASFGHSTYGDKRVMVSIDYYNNIIKMCEKAKEALSYNNSRGCYHTDWVNMKLYDWFKTNCK